MYRKVIPLAALLIPLSIVVAGAMIGAAIYFGQVDSDKEGATLASQPGESTSTTGASTQESNTGATSPTAASLSSSDLFVSYASDIGLDAGRFQVCLDKGTHRAAILADVRQAEEIGATGTPTFFINGKRLVGAQPLQVFQEIIDRELEGSASTQVSDYSAATQQLVVGGRLNLVPVELDISDSPRKGKGSVTLVEFTDYQCPFCLRYFSNTLPQLETKYEGKLSFVVKDLPLTNIHNKALAAAEAARCAGDQGEFWAMYDQLFNTQSQWSQAQ